MEFDWLTTNEIFEIVGEMRQEIFYRQNHDIGIKEIIVHPWIMNHLAYNPGRTINSITPNRQILKYLGYLITTNCDVPGYTIE